MNYFDISTENQSQSHDIHANCFIECFWKWWTCCFWVQGKTLLLWSIRSLPQVLWTKSIYIKTWNKLWSYMHLEFVFQMLTVLNEQDTFICYVVKNQYGNINEILFHIDQLLIFLELLIVNLIKIRWWLFVDWNSKFKVSFLCKWYMIHH